MKLVQTNRHPEGYDNRSHRDEIYKLDAGGFIMIRHLVDSMGTDHIEKIVEVKEAQVREVVYEPVGPAVDVDVNLYD